MRLRCGRHSLSKSRPSQLTGLRPRGHAVECLRSFVRVGSRGMEETKIVHATSGALGWIFCNVHVGCQSLWPAAPIEPRHRIEECASQKKNYREGFATLGFEIRIAHQPGEWDVVVFVCFFACGHATPTPLAPCSLAVVEACPVVCVAYRVYSMVSCSCSTPTCCIGFAASSCPPILAAFYGACCGRAAHGLVGVHSMRSRVGTQDFSGL
jgi:hypothetical protein